MDKQECEKEKGELRFWDKMDYISFIKGVFRTKEIVDVFISSKSKASWDFN